LNSGDRAYRADGEIFITGRTKEIILKAGRNLYPYEVEEIAARVAGVRKGCVVAFGAADPAAGTERLVVVAETRERDAAAQRRISSSITEQVTAAIGLPPDAVELLPPHSIPKTSSGKLRRDQTRRLYLARSLGKAAPPPWLQVLGLAITGGLRAAARGARKALEFVYGVYAATVFVLWLVPAWAIVSLTPNRRAAARFTPAALKVFLALVGCRMRIEGRANLATPGPVVYVSNHTSYFDVLVLMAGLGVEYHFVAKSEVHNMPFIGTFLRKLEHFAFNRGDRGERLRQAEEMEKALRRGESVFVFPEGTFTHKDGVRPFHLGAFKAAASTGHAIVPVALRGTRQFLRDGTYLPRPTQVTVTLCTPLQPRGGSQTSWQEVVRLRDLAREEIARYSGEPLL
jgi:fatty-acyl-CoA synthase